MSTPIGVPTQTLQQLADAGISRHQLIHHFAYAALGITVASPGIISVVSFIPTTTIPLAWPILGPAVELVFHLSPTTRIGMAAVSAGFTVYTVRQWILSSRAANEARDLHEPLLDINGPMH
jgi:hypothetical protein